jgi:NAD dependent epimerase/dehydratase family enzyme
MVLSRRGGALRRLLPPFRLGLGGPLGHGRQWWSWIALDDLGEMADGLLLSSQRMVAGRLDRAGVPRRTELEPALRAVLAE